MSDPTPEAHEHNCPVSIGAPCQCAELRAERYRHLSGGPDSAAPPSPEALEKARDLCEVSTLKNCYQCERIARKLDEWKQRGEATGFQNAVRMARAAKEFQRGAEAMREKAAKLADQYRRGVMAYLDPLREQISRELEEVAKEIGAEILALPFPEPEDGKCRHCNGAGCPACDARTLPEPKETS